MVLAWQAWIAVETYKDQLRENRINRVEWVSKFRNGEMWDLIINTIDTLRKDWDDSTKIAFMNDPKNRQFRVQFHRVLSYFEDLAYLYNSNTIERELIERGPGNVAIEYFQRARFWIHYLRAISGNQGLFVELEAMVKDLQKREKVNTAS